MHAHSFAFDQLALIITFDHLWYKRNTGWLWLVSKIIEHSRSTIIYIPEALSQQDHFVLLCTNCGSSLHLWNSQYGNTGVFKTNFTRWVNLKWCNFKYCIENSNYLCKIGLQRTLISKRALSLPTSWYWALMKHTYTLCASLLSRISPVSIS